MTDAALQGLAAQALNMARRDVEQSDEFNFLLAAYNASNTPPFFRLRRIEALVVERLGKDWLNSGRTKDIGFDLLRLAVKILPPDAIVFVTAANAFKTTDKLAALPAAEQLALLRASHARHHQAAKEGLMEVHDSIVALAQTPTRICQYMQRVHHGAFVGKPETKFFPQEDFHGRMKMYGDGDGPLNFTQRKTTTI